MKQLYFLFDFLTIFSASYAQLITGNGVALHDSGVPLSGANFPQKDTTYGVTADFDGRL
ncbi:MAG: hypothetical protein KJO39_06535 [Bacteroidia bacterium]|nr:hypothetical protein [Bacteroidia bacterium]NNF32003.1 hypothetical protein [Flavobacteriaceae bacterium]NNJ81182.1 hypothetical protein [Flavobacteriaceae bacterium]